MNGLVRAAVVIFSGVAVGILSAGCAKDTGGRTSEAHGAAVSIKDTRAELAKSKMEVNDSLAALDGLSAGASGGKLATSYKTFATSVKDLEAAAGRAREQANEMRANGRAYVAKWEKETEAVSSPELRAGAADRRQKIKAKFDQLVSARQGVRDAYQPFITDLKDIQKALANDLTPAGVESAKGAIDKAKAKGATLNERIDTAIAELDDVSGGMAAGAQPAPQGSQKK